MTGPTIMLDDLLTYDPDDGGILDYFADTMGDLWAYQSGYGEWRAWAVTHWQADLQGHGIEYELQCLLAAWNEAARRCLPLSAKDPDYDSVKAHIRASRRSQARVKSIEGMARARLAVHPDYWDAADVLNLRNGALDLETLNLSSHYQGDYLTYCLPYEYDPAAGCPNWREFWSRMEPETAAFLQEFAGYALTPDTQYELAVWLYGPPGGGKSTFLEGLTAVLGERATVLGLADIEHNRFALARLPGKTLAVATEQPADYLSSTHVLNALISGEPVNVDRKYRDAVTATPRVKLAWAMNELPRVRGANDGLFRRVKVVEFPAIPESERRPELKAAIRQERAGILNWALEGLRRLRQRGRFEIPAAIEAASAEFASRNDIPAAFLEECCDLGAAHSIASQALYNEYHSWCLATGHKPQSATSIAGDWRRLGFTKVKRPSGMVWEGLALSPSRPVFT